MSWRNAIYHAFWVTTALTLIVVVAGLVGYMLYGLIQSPIAVLAIGGFFFVVAVIATLLRYRGDA